MKPTDTDQSTDGEQFDAVPASPAGTERFDEYHIRRDPATGTQLVNIVDAPDGAWDTYIGRANPSFGVPDSEWANPFKLGPDGTRDEVVAQYREWLADKLTDQPAARGRLRDLKGDTLACWCVGSNGAGTKCHGDVLLDTVAVLCAADKAGVTPVGGGSDE